MTRLRNRLILAFVLATIVPLGATVWVAASLLDRSLAYATTEELDRLSRTLEDTARQFYQLERETLRQDAADGRVQARRFERRALAGWPAPVQDFWNSGEPERFNVTGAGGDHLDLMRRSAKGVDVYRRALGGIQMETLTAEYRRTRELVGATRSRDLRRGLTLTLLLLIALVWLASLAPLIFLAYRISTPIRQLTEGLTDFSDGDWGRRVARGGDDEVGRAIEAFNQMAERLQRNRDRLVYLTQVSSWQLLARKTAHELKNSLTPIRLTVEELLARQPADRSFMEQAAQIVVSEIETLERRVRAFSEFAAEPPLHPEAIDVNAIVNERIALLRAAHSDTTYTLRLAAVTPRAYASADLVKGILTNLLENAAEAAGVGGSILTSTQASTDVVVIEVHDSGHGLTREASATLFEPTITFKKRGMGLGLSIARKNALLCGGDVTLVPGELGGAGFRVVLPTASEPTPATLT